MGSNYLSAVMEDRELAEQVAELPEPPPGRPTLRGYTPLMQRLDDVIDVLLKLQATAAHVNPREAATVERPKPAVEYVRREIASSRLKDVERLLLRNRKEP